jgi:hypothetical protein
MEELLKKIALALAVILSLQFAYNPARADDVGAAIGAGTGMVIAGPPGAIIGAIIGGIFGRPNAAPYQCWIDQNFRRHCPKFPVR